MAAASQSRVRVAPNLYQRGDGVYVAGLTIDGRWTMPKLKARTKRQAKLELAALQLAAGQRVAESAQPPVVTFAQLAEEFLGRFEAQVNSGERSPRTLDHYESVLRCHLRPAWESLEVRSIDPDAVLELIAALRSNGCGPSVLKAVEQTASRLFRFALRRGYVDANPVGRLEPGERARVINDDRRVLSHQEIGRLIAAVESCCELAMLGLLLYAGLRQGELLGLRWADIDFEAGLIRLRQQWQRPRSGRPGALAPLKHHSVRDVVLSPQLAGRLREWKLASPFSQDSDFAFAANDEAPIHYTRMNRILHRLADKAGVARVSSHTFRRTFASHLIIDQGLDAVRVQRQLGHSRSSVTLDRYAFLFEQARYADDLRESIGASAYGALLNPPADGRAGAGRAPANPTAPRWPDGREALLHEDAAMQTT